MTFYFILNKDVFFENKSIPCKFYVSFFKIITILNHNQKLIFLKIYVFLYNKVKFFLKHHVHYIPFICDKKYLKF